MGWLAANRGRATPCAPVPAATVLSTDTYLTAAVD